MSRTVMFLHDVLLERQRQEAKFGRQRNADGTGPRSFARAAVPSAARMRARVDEHAKLGILTDADVLLEEVAEAFAETDPETLRAELVQIAAVATRWGERIDEQLEARRIAERQPPAPTAETGSPHD